MLRAPLLVLLPVYNLDIIISSLVTVKALHPIKSHGGCFAYFWLHSLHSAFSGLIDHCAFQKNNDQVPFSLLMFGAIISCSV